MKPEPMQHAKALPNTTAPIVKWFDQHGNTATAIICVAMIGGAIWFSYHRTTSDRSERAWARFSQARTAEDFASIAEDFPSTEVGAWARLSEGERLLESGISLMFTDRAAGLGDLKKADEALRKVVNASSAQPVARERAQWALAKSVETQSDADSTKAVAAYEAFLKEFPKSTYKAAAEERIGMLKSDRAKEFYAWFHKQKPKPADRAKPKDGLPAGHPPVGDMSKDLPEDGDSAASTEKKDDAKSDDKSAADASAEEKKPEEKKPDDKKSDAGDSPTEKPKDDAEKPKAEADKPKAEDAPKEKKEESKDAPAESK